MAAKLWRGSRGDSVRDLQQKLNANGYKLAEDGVFGSNTYNAVLDYQRKNKLAVDGVVGDETWGSLGKQQTQQVTPAPQSAAGTYTAYDPSRDNAYQEALAALKSAQQGTPQYSGTYDGQLKDLYDQIVNRDKFSYDINGDALFQQYKDLYTQQGKQSMMDTMGQAAALTGGYGNSYAQSVGQQTYQGYLQKLGEVAPELYQQAYSRYQDDGNRMMQQYEMLGDLKNDEYAKYQDAYNRWLAEREYAQGNADTAYERGYNQWLQEQNQRNADREFEENVRQYNENMAEQKRQFNAQMAYKSSGGGSGGGESGDDPAPKPGYGPGISTKINGAGLKASPWNYSKHNLEMLLRSGNFEGASKYMDTIITEVNEGQYKELMKLWDQYNKS